MARTSNTVKTSRKPVKKGLLPLRKMMMEAKIKALDDMIEELSPFPMYASEVEGMRKKRRTLYRQFDNTYNKK